MNNQENFFKILGKRKMIELMKSQFEYFIDIEADPNLFTYNRFDINSERLEYFDDYDNMHDLYHSIVGGQEVCLYHMNNDRNRSIEIPKSNQSVLDSLKKHQQEINRQSNVNNLEYQHTQQER